MSGRPDPTRRFSGRAADYVRGRPGYPEAVFDAVVELAGLGPGSVVADVGAGTGASSEPFLRRGFAVVAVEPNAAMRAAAVGLLGDRPGFRALDGTAEATGLPPASVALVFAAQAFHWFDAPRARAEFARVLAPAGAVALVWNARRAEGTPFLEDYERLLLDHGTDYREVGHRGVGPDRLAAFYGGPLTTRRFENFQELDRDGLRARLLSSSYVPAAGQPGHTEMLAALDGLFDRHSRTGRVRLEYDVDLFVGRLPAAPS